MPFYFLLSLAYLVLIVIWFVSLKKSKPMMVTLGSAAILCAGPFFFVLGMFFGTFDGNVCYSESIERVSKLSVNVAKSGDNRKIEQLANMLTKLPLYGYETNCGEIKKALDDYEIQK